MMRTLTQTEVGAVTGGLGYATSANPDSGTITAYATQGDLAVPIKLPLGKALSALVALALKAFPKYAYQG
jgi:hypothetical protein